MARAYLKVHVEVGEESPVQKALLQVEGVVSADLTSGEQDIICVAEGDTYEELLRLVVNRIRNIDGIRDTVTNLVLG